MNALTGKLVISLFEKHKIKDAYLFGSVLTDKFDEKKSDNENIWIEP